MTKIPDFCCSSEFDPCCQWLGDSLNRDQYRFIGHSSMRECVNLCLTFGHVHWYRSYQVSGYEPRRVGDWEIQKFTVDERGAYLHNISVIDPGKRITPDTYTKLVWHGSPDKVKNSEPDGQIVMSDTPSEIMDHMEFIDRAYGRVLINGLGLGMVANALLHGDKRNCIEYIDVVESNKEVIDLVGHYFKGDDKITIHHADAFTIEWPEDKYWHCAWHDIWYEINPDDYEEHRTLHRKYRGRVKYQDSWMRRWYMGFLWWERRQKEKENAALPR